MINLLSAGFYRIKKNPLFYTFSIIVVIFEGYTVFNEYMKTSMPLFSDLIAFDKMFFSILILGLMSSIFVSNFLGEDYNNGTIRNKIVAGCDKKMIYLSNFILMNLVNLFYLVLLFIVLFGMGLPLIGRPSIGVDELSFLVFLFFSISVSFTSILSFIGMMSSSMTRSMTVSMLTTIVLLFGSAVMINILQEPKMINIYAIQDGENMLIEEPNPKYPSEFERRIVEFLIDVNPAGEALKIANNPREKHYKLVFYSLGVIIIFTGVGIILFDRKELN